MVGVQYVLHLTVSICDACPDTAGIEIGDHGGFEPLVSAVVTDGFTRVHENPMRFTCRNWSDHLERKVLRQQCIGIAVQRIQD